MSANPGVTRMHHFSPTVCDVEASAAWYQEVFELDRVPVTFPHHDREETGHAVLLIDPRSGLAIGLHAHTGNAGETFDERRTGLDHISFEVADHAALEAWVVRLDELTSTGDRFSSRPFVPARPAVTVLRSNHRYAGGLRRSSFAQGR